MRRTAICSADDRQGNWGRFVPYWGACPICRPGWGHTTPLSSAADGGDLVRFYEGSYDAVRRYAKVWRAKRGAAMAEAYVPLSFAPGEAYQFDWSHEVVLINGTTVTVKVAHVRLCHSRMMFVRAYPRETQEMVRLPRIGGHLC